MGTLKTATGLGHSRLASCLILCLIGLTVAKNIEYEDYDRFTRRDTQGIITPQGLCWEYFGGSTFVFWSYINAGGPVEVSIGSANQFGVNGAPLLTSSPPSNFTTGEVSNSGLIIVNLGPAGLLFSWTVESKTAHINGSSTTHICPYSVSTVFVDCTGSSANIPATISTISSLISINGSRISVEQVPVSKRTFSSNRRAVYADFTLKITFQPSSTENSALWASHRLNHIITNDNTARTTLNNAIGSTIETSRVDPTGYEAINPTEPVLPKKHEMWLGTLLGIILACVFGISIVILSAIAIGFRIHACQERRRSAKLVSGFRKPNNPSLDSSGRSSGDEKNSLTNGHQIDKSSSQSLSKKRN